MADIDPDIRAYYERGGERTRISDTLELLRTKGVARPPAANATART